MAQYWQRGESIDYTNTGSKMVRHGDVVPVGNRIGVAGCDIAPGACGSLHVTGVFIMPKASGTALSLGADVFWDSATETVVTTGSVPAGWVVEATASDSETVKVKIG